MNLLQQFFAGPEGLAVYAVLAIGLVDFLLGVTAAVRDNTFKLDAVAAWLRKHLAGRIFPIGILLAVGYFAAQPALSVLGGAWAAGYLAETAGSIADSWSPTRTRLKDIPTD